MKKLPYLLRLAAGVIGPVDKRVHRIGAVAERSDGVIVHARNGSNKEVTPEAHAEARLLRKAGLGATVYVTRVCKGGRLGLAKPCPNCQALLKSARVTRVYYTIGDSEYGVMEL